MPFLAILGLVDSRNRTLFGDMVLSTNKTTFPGSISETTLMPSSMEINHLLFPLTSCKCIAGIANMLASSE